MYNDILVLNTSSLEVYNDIKLLTNTQREQALLRQRARRERKRQEERQYASSEWRENESMSINWQPRNAPLLKTAG